MELLELHRQFRRYLSIEEGLGIQTVKAMESSFKTFLRRMKVTALKEMDEGLLREFFYNGCEVHHWSSSHYSNNHKYLKRFLEWCMGKGLIKKNPIAAIKVPKAPKPVPRRLSEEDARKVLFSSFDLPCRSSFEQIRNFTIIYTFLFTGLRMRELLNLQIMDIDLTGKTLLVRHGKGDKDRMLPLHYKLIRTLERYLKERKSSGKKSEWVFNGARSDKKLLPKDLYRVCKKIGEESGVRFTPHQLRHTFGSISIEQGFGLFQLKDMMGHSNIASTMIYLKISPKSLRESLNKLDIL